MGSLAHQFARERLKGYYLVPQHPFLHPLSPFWAFRGTPGLPLGPLVIDIATDYQCPGDGTFPNLEDACDSFFMCSGGNHHKMTCNPGLKFDGSIGQCNWEAEVDDNCNWSEDAIAIGKQNS